VARCVVLVILALIVLGTVLLPTLHDIDDGTPSGGPKPGVCQTRPCTCKLINVEPSPLLRGDNIGDQFGTTFSLSSQGRRLAVSAAKNVYLNSLNETVGYIRVFEDDIDGSDWFPLP